MEKATHWRKNRDARAARDLGGFWCRPTRGGEVAKAMDKTDATRFFLDHGGVPRSILLLIDRTQAPTEELLDKAVQTIIAKAREAKRVLMEAHLITPSPQQSSPEFREAVQIANKVLDRPYADPDDDTAVLARQFLRLAERVEDLEGWRRAMSTPAQPPPPQPAGTGGCR
jgi:hypothetical protein